MKVRVLGLVLLALALPAHADWQTRSWSRWQIEQHGASVLFGIERVELERLGLPPEPAWLLAELRRTIDLRECTLAEATPVPGVDSTVLQARLRFACDKPLVAPSLTIRTLLDSASSPMHYASIAFSGGGRGDALFTRGGDTHEFAFAAPAASTPGATFVDYLGLGFEHILAGLDHVAFLLCMLLVSPRLGHRLWMITGFTLGHSITLSLATLGMLSAETAGVEALIGFTVALLAAESWHRSARHTMPGALLIAVLLASAIARALGALPALPLQSVVALLLLAPAYLLLAARSAHPSRLHLGMTAVFGLVHGLGFASVLRTLGLPADQRGWALAGFNIGVEAGQLLLLLVFAGVLGALPRILGETRRQYGEHALAGLLCALGLFWFVGRSSALP